jgi:hypothetical protein
MPAVIGAEAADGDPLGQKGPFDGSEESMLASLEFSLGYDCIPESEGGIAGSTSTPAHDANPWTLMVSAAIDSAFDATALILDGKPALTIYETTCDGKLNFGFMLTSYRKNVVI